MLHLILILNIYVISWQYQRAVAKALLDRVSDEDASRLTTVSMISLFNCTFHSDICNAVWFGQHFGPCYDMLFLLSLGVDGCWCWTRTSCQGITAGFFPSLCKENTWKLEGKFDLKNAMISLVVLILLLLFDRQLKKRNVNWKYMR